jgi:hypothetical protein
MIVQRQMLGLEIKGFKTRGRSAYVLIKEQYNLKGNKMKVYQQFTTMIETAKQIEGMY